MKNPNCNSHAKHCQQERSLEDELLELLVGSKKAGFFAEPALSSGAGCGYKEEHENWEDVVIVSEMSKVSELRVWADKLVLLDKAYKAKIRRLEGEYEQALTAGFEEAYTCVKDTQNRVSELESQLVAAWNIIETCCPEKCPQNECRDQQVS